MPSFHSVEIWESEDLGVSPSGQVYFINADALKWSQNTGRPVWEWLWEPEPLPKLPRDDDDLEGC